MDIYGYLAEPITTTTTLTASYLHLTGVISTTQINNGVTSNVTGYLTLGPTVEPIFVVAFFAFFAFVGAAIGRPTAGIITFIVFYISGILFQPDTLKFAVVVFLSASTFYKWMQVSTITKISA